MPLLTPQTAAVLRRPFPPPPEADPASSAENPRDVSRSLDPRPARERVLGRRRLRRALNDEILVRRSRPEDAAAALLRIPVRGSFFGTSALAGARLRSFREGAITDSPQSRTPSRKRGADETHGHWRRLDKAMRHALARNADGPHLRALVLVEAAFLGSLREERAHVPDGFIDTCAAVPLFSLSGKRASLQLALPDPLHRLFAHAVARFYACASAVVRERGRVAVLISWRAAAHARPDVFRAGIDTGGAVARLPELACALAARGDAHADEGASPMPAMHAVIPNYLTDLAGGDALGRGVRLRPAGLEADAPPARRAAAPRCEDPDDGFVHVSAERGPDAGIAVADPLAAAPGGGGGDDDGGGGDGGDGFVLVDASDAAAAADAAPTDGAAAGTADAAGGSEAEATAEGAASPAAAAASSADKGAGADNNAQEGAAAGARGESEEEEGDGDGESDEEGGRLALTLSELLVVRVSAQGR